MLPILPLFWALAGSIPAKSLPSSLWKKSDFDTSGTVRGTDSLTYDAYGKLLGLIRKGPDGRPAHSVQYRYDDSGRAVNTVKLSPEGEVLEEADCAYANGKLAGWTRTDHGIVMDGISFQIDRQGRHSAYVQVATNAFSFLLDSLGRAQRVSLLGGMAGGTLSSAEFRFDARHRHVATWFFGPDSDSIGRDTLIREEDGRLRELRRFDASGKRVATVERAYGPRGEVIRKVLRNAKGQAEIRQDLVYLAGDSLARLNRSGSSWKGPAATAPCELEWFRSLELGIEPTTLYGLSQLYRPPPRTHWPDPAAFRDSLDRERDRDEARVKEFRDSLSFCGRSDRGDRFECIRASVDSLLRTDPRTGPWREALDTAAGAFLEAGGQRAYGYLLSRVRADSASLPPDGILLDHLLKYRMGWAFDGFCAVPAPAAAQPAGPKRAGLTQAGNGPETLLADFDYRRSFLDWSPADTAGGGERNTKWTYEDLYRHIATFLRTGGAASLDSIRGYASDGWCGTGSEGWTEPMRMAFLIRDLERGDLRAAVRRTTDPERVRRMLACRGEDWEAFFLGGVGDDQYGSRWISLGMLAKYGSAASLRTLLTLKDRGPAGYDPNMEEVWGRFLLEPGDRIPSDGNGYAAWDRDIHAPVLPEDLRVLLLDRLKSHVDRNLYGVRAYFLTQLFARLRFPERDEYLERLAEYPNGICRKAALQALGKTDADTASAPASRTLELAFTSSGVPLRDLDFSFALPGCGTADSCFWGTSAIAREGRFTMNRIDYLFAWRQAKALKISHAYLSENRFRETPIFNVIVPLRENPGDTLRVDIPLHRLSLKLIFPPGFDSTQEKRMRIRVETSEQKPGSGWSIGIGLRPEIVFDRIGDGNYRFAIELPGLAPWESGPIKVFKDVSYPVPLRRGN